MDKKILILSWIVAWSKLINLVSIISARNFIFLGSKIIADGDCIHEIKRHLLLGRKLWPT